MAATLALDTIEGAELQLAINDSRRVRTGMISGIDVDATNDSDVLGKA